MNFLSYRLDDVFKFEIVAIFSVDGEKWTHYDTVKRGRRRGLMVSALDSRSSGPGSSPGRSHCVVFLGKILYSHSASLHPGV